MLRFPPRALFGAKISSCRGRRLSVLLGAGLLIFDAPLLFAQSPPPPAPHDARADAGRGAALTARYHVRQMENVLERAVQHAADLMRRRFAAFTPDVLALAGAPRAQGFRIEGYGLFFSVEVPRLSESVTWALRVLSEDRDERVVASLQKVAEAEQDPVVRADVERAIRSIQLQHRAPAAAAPAGAEMTPRQTTSSSAPPARAGGPVAGSGREGVAAQDGPVDSASRDAASAPSQAYMSAAPAPAPPPEAPAIAPPRDPSAVYEDEVKQALVDAMLDYAGSLQLPSGEWVTIAARDAGYVAFPDAVSDMVTVTLSIRASDLVDFRAQRLTREEARTRVLVREF